MRHRLIMTLALLLAISVCGCSEAPTPPPDGPAEIVTQGPIRFGVVADDGDSLDIEIRFAVVDTPEVAQINWENLGVDPVQPLLVGSTAPATPLVDTLRTRKPAAGTTDGYEMRAQAVDTLGNDGPFSTPQAWWIQHLDTVGPPPPQQLDPVPGDTIVVTSARVIAVWPQTAQVKPDSLVQFYAAVLRSDGFAECAPPPPAPGALYDSGSFAGGCDSAAALLGAPLVEPALPESALRYASWIADRSDPFLWPARWTGGG